MRGWDLDDGDRYVRHTLGLVLGRHDKRLSGYFRLGLSTFSDDPLYMTTAGGLRMNVPLSESVSFRPELGILLFVPIEEYHGVYIPIPFLVPRVKMVVDL